MSGAPGYGKSVLIAVDQLFNTVLGGWPDESLSSRAHRAALAGRPWSARIIDALFFWENGHCLAS